MPSSTPNRATIRQFLLPNIAELLLCVVLGFGLLLAGNFGFFREALTEDYATARQTQMQNRDIEPIDTTASRSPLAILSTVVFWGGIGCMSYIFIWFIQNFYRVSRQDSSGAHNIMPAGYSKDRYIRSTLSKNALALGSLFAIAAYLIGVQRYGMPFLSDLFLRPFMQTTGSITNYLAAAASLGMATLAVFVFFRLMRITSYAWRSFFA